MTPLQALALDVDGTLLTSDHRLTPATRAALAAARRAGVLVVLASARSPLGLLPILGPLGLEDQPLIAFGGALVRDGESVILDDRIPAADAARVAAHAVELGLEVGWYAGDRWLVSETGPGIAFEEEVTRQVPELMASLDGRPDPHKLLCIASRPDRASALLELRDGMPASTRGQLSYRHYLEVTAAGVDKAHGFAALLDHLGIPVERSAAIGDGENDIGLLRFAGRGIAMGHSIRVVAEAADAITDTNDRDGVAKAVASLLGAAAA